MKIYTKTGDDGGTGLFGGPRVRKNDPRIEAYGTVDELNAVLGVVRTHEVPGDIDQLLQQMQNELFDLGAELATPEPERFGLKLLGDTHIEQLEQAIDRHEAELEPLKQFILPGGTPAAAALHLARTVCRRAERMLVEFNDSTPISRNTIIYLNRLSDLLFVLARVVNHRAGLADVPWQSSSPV